jgi:hypothetical protein
MFQGFCRRAAFGQASLTPSSNNPPVGALMHKQNFNQVRKQRELARKVRQQEKQQRRSDRLKEGKDKETEVATPAPASDAGEVV